MPRRSARYKRRSKNSNKKKYLVIFALCVGFFLFLTSYAFYKQFHQTYISASSITSQDFRTQDFYTVAVISTEDSFDTSPLVLKSVKLIFFSTKHKDFLVYEIPSDLEVSFPGKFGTDNISKAFALGTMDIDTSSGCDLNCFNAGADLTRVTLEGLIGAKIDRFVIVDPSLADFSEDIFITSDFMKLFQKSKIQSLKKSLRTDMSFADFLHFYSLARDFSKNDIKYETFTQSEVLDSSLRQLTYDSELAEERKSIAILNGTSIPGLASFGARVVKNRGGHVVAEDNAAGDYEETYLIVENKDNLTVSYLAQFFDVQDVYSKEELPFSITDSAIDRAEVTLILGLDNGLKY